MVLSQCSGQGSTAAHAIADNEQMQLESPQGVCFHVQGGPSSRLALGWELKQVRAVPALCTWLLLASSRLGGRRWSEAVCDRLPDPHVEAVRHLTAEPHSTNSAPVEEGAGLAKGRETELHREHTRRHDSLGTHL